MANIAHWKMNDNLATTTVLDTIGSNNGTAQHNTEDISVTGKINTALSFDSNDWVDCGDTSNYVWTDKLSVFCWIKKTGLFNLIPTIIGKWKQNSNDCEWMISITSDDAINYKLQVRYGDDTGLYTGLYETNTTVITKNTWHHIGFTFNAGTLKLYVDGNEIASTMQYSEPDSTLFNGIAKLYMGIADPAGGGAGTVAFEGDIDDVRISSSVFTQDTIDFLYNSGNGTETSLADEIELEDTVTLSEEVLLQLNPEELNLEDTITLSEEIELKTTPEIINLEDTITLYDKIEGVNKASYATDIKYHDGHLYISTDETPAQVVKVEIDYNGLGEQRWRTYTLDIGLNNAKALTINELFGELYVACSNGKIAKMNNLDDLDLERSIVIIESNTDNMITIDDSEEYLSVFIGTDSLTAELYKLDYSEITKINTYFPFIRELSYNINTYLPFLKGGLVNTDLRFITKKENIINTDFRFTTVPYNSVNHTPTPRTDFKVYINGNILPDNDVKLDSIRVQHFADEESKAYFILNRKFDRLDTNEEEQSSQITNQNSVTIYIRDKLIFTGKINRLNPITEEELVNVEATSSETWSTKKVTVDLPIPSINEQLHLYHAQIQEIDIYNPNWDIGMTEITNLGCTQVPLGDPNETKYLLGGILGTSLGGNKILTGTGNKFTRSMEGLNIDIVSGEGAHLGNYKIVKYINSNTVELDRCPILKSPSGAQGILLFGGSMSGGIGYIHDNPVIYRGIKISLGTQEFERVFKEEGTGHPLNIGFAIENQAELANWIETGQWQPDPNYEYFWYADIQYIGLYRLQNRIMPLVNPIVTNKYIGTSLQPLTSDLYKILGLWYRRQRVYNNWVYPEEFYYVGTYPFKEISASKTGRYQSTPHLEDRENGLYNVTGEYYNYRNYARNVANLEYEKLKNINGDILPITNIGLNLTIDGFLYYDIRLLNRLNITNTTETGVYKNNNGFPVSVKGITINADTMKVTLDCDNTKSKSELEDIDDRYPQEPTPNPGHYTFLDKKFDITTQSYIE